MNQKRAMMKAVMDPWSDDPNLRMAVQRAQHALEMVIQSYSTGIIDLATQPKGFPFQRNVQTEVENWLTEHDDKFLKVWKVEVRQTTHPDSFFVVVTPRDAIQRMGEIDTNA